jgi:hypothetical protein
MALVEKAGIPGPFANEKDVDAYYQKHADEFDNLPENPVSHDAAWQKIQLQIREILAVEFQQQYDQRVGNYIAGLESAARISY